MYFSGLGIFSDLGIFFILVFLFLILMFLFQAREMRLKNVDGPLSVYNGNESDILNSPKRINTLQNSNITSHLNHANLNQNNFRLNSNNVITSGVITTSDLTSTEEATLNNINAAEQVQWCNPVIAQKRELSNYANNRINHQQLFNINNTLAVSLGGARHGKASSICSESSPDDSLLDFEGECAETPHLNSLSFLILNP